MTAVECELCTRPTPDMARVCPRCAHGLVLDLRAVAALESELAITCAGLARMGAGGGRSSSEPRLPVNLGADERGRALKGVLTATSTFIANRRGLERPLDGMTLSAEWLLDHIEWIRHHETGPDTVTRIRDVVVAARRAIDRPANRVYLGTCNTCQTPLYAQEDATETACRTCETPDGERLYYDVAERRRWMLGEVEHVLGNASQVANIVTGLGVKLSASTVRMWVKRGKLQPHDHLPPFKPDGEPRPRYRVGDVIAAASNTS